MRWKKSFGKPYYHCKYIEHITYTYEYVFAYGIYSG